MIFMHYCFLHNLLRILPPCSTQRWSWFSFFLFGGGVVLHRHKTFFSTLWVIWFSWVWRTKKKPHPKLIVCCSENWSQFFFWVLDTMQSAVFGSNFLALFWGFSWRIAYQVLWKSSLLLFFLYLTHGGCVGVGFFYLLYILQMQIEVEVCSQVSFLFWLDVSDKQELNSSLGLYIQSVFLIRIKMTFHPWVQKLEHY